MQFKIDDIQFFFFLGGMLKEILGFEIAWNLFTLSWW